MCAHIEERIQARVVTPDGFVALGVRQRGQEAPRGEAIEETVLRLHRKRPVAELDEHRRSPREAAGRRFAVHRQYRKSLASHEATEDDVVEDPRSRGARSGVGD